MHPILRAFPRGLLSLPPRRAYWRADGFQVASGGLRASEVVISRGRCRFGRFDLSRLPANKRSQALALQLPAWSPFSDSDYAIAWSEAGWASVWVWDRAALAAASAAEGKTGRMPRLLPESMLRGRGEDGMRLLRVLDGFEAQHWSGGELLASRWWPAMPDAQAQIAFQRDCGVGTESLIDALRLNEAPLADKPWAVLSTIGSDGGQIAPAELLAYGVVALALIVPGLSLGVDHLRLAQARRDAQAELARESDRSQGVLAARDTALTAADQLQALQELQPYPSPLVHMMAVARALPESGAAYVKEWELNDGKIRLLLAAPSGEISGGEHVRALEQTGLFTDVKILTQADPRQMAFTMKLKPQAALAMPEPAASSGTAGAAAPAQR